jgi:hypothetical protein
MYWNLRLGEGSKNKLGRPALDLSVKNNVSTQENTDKESIHAETTASSANIQVFADTIEATNGGIAAIGVRVA